MTFIHRLDFAVEPVDTDVVAADMERLPALAAQKASLVQLSTQMSVEELFESIACSCLAQITANAEALAQSYAIETLHQMRVGLRRLRIALDLFKNVLEFPPVLQQELDWLNAQLSDARDWDVLAEATLLTLATELPDLFQQMIKFQAVKRSIFGRARQQHKVALTAVRSARCLCLMQQLKNWLNTRAWRFTISAKRHKRLLKPAEKYVCNSLIEQQQHLIKRGKCLHRPSVHSVHRLRIAAKKMRYAVEFFRSLYSHQASSRKTVQLYIDSLSALQQHLGQFNDVAVANVLLHQLQQEQPKLAANIDLIRAYLLLDHKSDFNKTSVLWKKFSLMKLPC